MIRTVQIIFFLTLFSCSQSENDKELIGIWNNFPSGGPEEFQFYKDSVISYYHNFSRKGTWEANNSQIRFHFPSLKNIEGYRENYKLDYKIRGDSLFIKNLEDTVYRIPVFFKVTNYWKHYLRQFNLDQIDLPEADFHIKKIDSINYGIDLLVGYKNNKLSTIKTKAIQYVNHELFLDNIKSFVYAERAQYSEDIANNLHFNLIADKNVSPQQIDSIKNILNVFPDMKIFRVYKNDAANYGKYDIDNGKFYNWSWYGRFE